MNNQQDLRTLAAKWQVAADCLQTRFSDDMSDGQQYVLRQCASELEAALREAAAQLGWAEESAVGCLTISRWKGADSMVNHDFDYYGSLPDGSYSVYTRPQLPAGEPDGWKLVPVEPTDDMLEAYQEAMCGLRNMTSVDDNEFVILWSAMLAAAPQPDSEESK